MAVNVKTCSFQKRKSYKSSLLENRLCFVSLLCFRSFWGDSCDTHPSLSLPFSLYLSLSISSSFFLYLSIYLLLFLFFSDPLPRSLLLFLSFVLFFSLYIPSLFFSLSPILIFLTSSTSEYNSTWYIFTLVHWWNSRFNFGFKVRSQNKNKKGTLLWVWICTWRRHGHQQLDHWIILGLFFLFFS